jgi:hypothetical protein
LGAISALKPPWPFIPDLSSGAFWLFHVMRLIPNIPILVKREGRRGFPEPKRLDTPLPHGIVNESSFRSSEGRDGYEKQKRR